MSRQQSTAEISRHVIKLARQIDASSSPGYIPVEPGEGCATDGCFDNVAAIVKRQGGSLQHGWSMREQPQVFVAAKFHAVWRSPDNRLIDVTPRTDGQRQTLFLPDSTREWDGGEIEERRILLQGEPCYCGSGVPFRLCHGLASD